MDQCVRDRFAKCFRWEVKFVDHRPALADLNNTEFTFKPLHDPIDQLTDRALDMHKASKSAEVFAASSTPVTANTPRCSSTPSNTTASVRKGRQRLPEIDR